MRRVGTGVADLTRDDRGEVEEGGAVFSAATEERHLSRAFLYNLGGLGSLDLLQSVITLVFVSHFTYSETVLNHNIC